MRAFARLFGMAMILAAGLLHAPASHAETILVKRLGDDTPPCGDFGDECATMQGGINQAAIRGDTVYCNDIFDAKKGIVAGKGLTIENCWVLTTGGDPCVTINTDLDLAVEILKMKCEQESAAQDGIVFNSGKFLDIKKSEISGPTALGSGCGVLLRSGTRSRLDNSTITRFGSGVCLESPSGPSVGGDAVDLILADNGFGVVVVTSGTAIDFNIMASTIMIGGTGIYSSGTGALVIVEGTKITGQNLGLDHPNNGKIFRYCRTILVNNDEDGTFTSEPCL